MQFRKAVHLWRCSEYASGCWNLSFPLFLIFQNRTLWCKRRCAMTTHQAFSSWSSLILPNISKSQTMKAVRQWNLVISLNITREIFSPSCSIDNHADIPSSPRDRYIHTPGYKGKKNTDTHAQIQTLIKRLIWILQ